MHICIVCNEYPPCKHGGIGSFSKDLAQGLVSQGHNVSIIGIYNKRELDFDKDYSEEIEGVNVHRFALKKKFNYHRLDLVYNRFVLYKEIKKLHARDSIDVLEAPDFDGWLPMGTPNKIPLVSRLHGGVTTISTTLNRKVSFIMKAIEKCQLKHSDLIVSVSKYTAELTSNVLGLENKSHVIYNAVKMPSQILNKDIEEGLVLFYGSIVPKKGVTELIIAFDSIAGIFPKAKLVLAGKNTYMHEGKAYEEFLYDLLSEQNKEKVVFTGPLDRDTELFPLVARANLCCFPSHTESFSLAPLEAMSMKKAVLFTIYTSGPEAIEDGVSGVLADTKDPQDIFLKIKSVLEDESFAKTLGENAKERIETHFSYESWISKNCDMFESMKKVIL